VIVFSYIISINFQIGKDNNSYFHRNGKKKLNIDQVSDWQR